MFNSLSSSSPSPSPGSHSNIPSINLIHSVTPARNQPKNSTAPHDSFMHTPSPLRTRQISRTHVHSDDSFKSSPYLGAKENDPSIVPSLLRTPSKPTTIFRSTPHPKRKSPTRSNSSPGSVHTTPLRVSAHSPGQYARLAPRPTSPRARVRTSSTSNGNVTLTDLNLELSSDDEDVGPPSTWLLSSRSLGKAVGKVLSASKKKHDAHVDKKSRPTSMTFQKTPFSRRARSPSPSPARTSPTELLDVEDSPTNNRMMMGPPRLPVSAQTSWQEELSKPRAPIQRLVSSATLFFGPAIPGPSKISTPIKRDDSFDEGFGNKSFEAFTPSPPQQLLTKFEPKTEESRRFRDSGIGLSDESLSSNDHSSSFENDPDLVTPILPPPDTDNWPRISDQPEAFMARALAAPVVHEELKAPDTPKKSRVSIGRAWASAAAPRTNHEFMDALGINASVAKKGPPRKSMPSCWRMDDDEDAMLAEGDESPSARREAARRGVQAPPPIPRWNEEQAPLVLPENNKAGLYDREFIVEAEMGEGEFGRVDRVRQKNGTQVFAVKQSKRYEGSRHRLRLREEVDILSHLAQRHGRGKDNVLQFVDSWEEDDILFIRTELCALGNFARFLWEYGRSFERLDEGRVWKIVVNIADGLNFIHDAGVIHLDLKPSNILISAEGQLKIGDFGMASFWPRPLDRYGFEREGDKVYLAPEVLRGVYGPAADVFGLGMVLLETAANVVLPDQGAAWHVIRAGDLSGTGLEGTTSEALHHLISSLLRPVPEERPTMRAVCSHAIVARAREFGQGASVLQPTSEDFLGRILDMDAMEL